MSFTSTVAWQPIETIPHGERIFVADLIDGILVTAIAELQHGETIIYAAGHPATTTKWWTHWAAFPVLPKFTAKRRAKNAEEAHRQLFPLKSVSPPSEGE